MRPKTPDSQPEKVQMDLYTIRLPNVLITQIKTLADKRGVTHAQVAREAIFAYLAKGK